jgi:hypothetical protein
MPDIRTIKYDDGRWCEQQYVGGKLHGTWTVFHANGQKDWERLHSNGRHEGYLRKWDDSGRLIEEYWLHLNVMHGLWRTWNEAGVEEIVNDFYFGYPRKTFDETTNADFNAFIKPYYGLEPAEFSTKIQEILPNIRRKSLRMKKFSQPRMDLAFRGSFWNHVNILGAGEEWPYFRGQPLFPIIQIKCADIPLSDNPLSEFSFVTLFSIAGDVPANFGEDIVVRFYRSDEKLVTAKPPSNPLDCPTELSFCEELISYPDENDLPPGMKVFLDDFGDPENVLCQDEKLNSRLVGWPGWIQNGRLSGFYKFAFQVDSLDVENWDCGDCSIHYFFLNPGMDGFEWCQEMC